MDVWMIPMKTSLVIKLRSFTVYVLQMYVHCPLTLGPQMVPVITASTTVMESVPRVCRVLTLTLGMITSHYHPISSPPCRHVDLVQVRRHGVHVLLVLLHVLAQLLEQLHRLLLRLGRLLLTLK